MCTVLVGCIVGSSVDVWQEMHPEDLRSASSWDWPWNGAASCEAPVGKFELARRAKKKDNAETQRIQRFRREDVPGFWSGSILCASERKLHGAEKRKKCPARVNIFESLSRLQRGSPAGENDVFTQWRTVFHSDAEIFADRVADGGLEEQKLQRLGAFKPEKIEVCKPSQFGSDLEIRSCVDEEDARVDEIRLAFLFARPKRWNEASRCGQKNAGTEKSDAFPIPKAEKPAAKVRKIHDGIEPAGAPVAWIRIARSVKRGNAVAHPVLVIGNLGGSHLCIDRDALARNRIESVLAESLVKRMRQIDPANMSAAEPAEVTNANAMKNRACPGILIDHVANRRRANQKAVVVIMDAGIIFIPGGDEFRGVAGEKEILQIDVAEYHLLVAAFERVEAAVRVFLKELEIRQIVLDASGMDISKDADGRLLIHKKEAAKIRVELLNSRARGNEIVIRTKIVKFHFHESFLKAHVRVKAVGAAAYVRSDDAELSHLQIVQADLGSDSNAPVHGLERGIAVK